jgi:hypothetical protein
MNLKKGSCYLVFFNTKDRCDILAHIVRLFQNRQKHIQEKTPFHHTGFIYNNGTEYIILEARLFKGSVVYNLQERIYNYNGKIEIYELQDLKNNAKQLNEFSQQKYKYSILKAIASITIENKKLDKFLNKFRLSIKNKTFCSEYNCWCFQRINKNEQHQLEILIRQQKGAQEMTPIDLYLYCKNNCKKIIL